MSPVEALSVMYANMGQLDAMGRNEAAAPRQEAVTSFATAGKVISDALMDGLPKWGDVCGLYAIAHKFVSAYGSTHHQKELKAAADRLGITFLEPEKPFAETAGNAPPLPKDRKFRDGDRVILRGAEDAGPFVYHCEAAGLPSECWINKAGHAGYIRVPVSNLSAA